MQVEATRNSTGEEIVVNYQDMLGETTHVNASVYYGNGTLAWTDSVDNPPNSIWQTTWDTADNNTDYTVVVTATHTSMGEAVYRTGLPAVAGYSAPFDLSFLGDYGYVNRLLPFAIILATAAVFSTLTAPVGLFASCTVAGVLYLIGWADVDVTLLSVAFCMAVMLALTRRKGV